MEETGECGEQELKHSDGQAEKFYRDLKQRGICVRVGMEATGYSRFSDGQVTFRWRDSAHHNEQKLLTLSLDEFLRRFLLHILPKGFVRIRNFGFLANRKRAKLLPLCFHLLGATPQPQAEQHASSTKDCPDRWRCGHVQTALPDARRTPRLRSLLAENAHPVKR